MSNKIELTEQDKTKIKEIDQSIDRLIDSMQTAITIMGQLSGKEFDPSELDRLTGKTYGEQND